MGDQRENLTRTSKYRSPSSLTRPIVKSIFRRSIRHGCVRLQFDNEHLDVGSGEPRCVIEPPNLNRLLRLLLRPDLKVADHYVHGFWNCERTKLYRFLELLFENKDTFFWRYFNYLNGRSPIRDLLAYRLFPSLINRKTANHYSSNTEFMKVVLGETLLYTCAFYEDDNDTLEEAQLNKIRKVAERLKLKATDNVLELGCGWGNAAQFVSKQYGCHVTGVNLTKAQVDYAERHKNDLVDFVHSSVSGFSPNRYYSKIYSIGMLEHIGVTQFDSFFSKVHGLLDEKGTALIHCIVREKPGSTNAWIDRMIFPGGYIPRVSEIVNSVEGNGLSIKAIHIHEKSNYFRTLDAWRSNFYDNEPNLRNLFSDELTEDETEYLMRMWDFYLTVSQLCFSPQFGQYQNVQIILEKS